MWISVNEKLPEESGWYLCSTNLGFGIFQYNQPMNEIPRIFLASLKESSATKVLHWDYLPDCPPDDYDANAGGFQREIK